MSKKEKYRYAVQACGEDVILNEDVLSLITEYTHRNLPLVSGYVALQWLKKDMEDEKVTLKRDYGNLEELLSDLLILSKATIKDFENNTDFFTDILDVVTPFVLMSCVAESDTGNKSLSDKLYTLVVPVTGELSKLGKTLSFTLNHVARPKFYELLKGEL